MATLADFDLLIVPGYDNAHPPHWQSHWAQLYPHSTRVLQDEWLAARCPDWSERLDSYVRLSARPAILIAHSLGCVLVAHWAKHLGPRRVKAALLVAPADIESPDFPIVVEASFAPVPLQPLPFPATVVLSQDDPYCSVAGGRSLASAWAAETVDAGALGHINSDSNLGYWPHGQQILTQLVARIT